MFKLQPGIYKTKSGASVQIIDKLSGGQWLGIMTETCGLKSSQTWTDGGYYFDDKRDAVLNLVDPDPVASARSEFIETKATLLAGLVFDLIHGAKDETSK